MPTVIYNGQTLPMLYGKYSMSENEKTFNFSCQFFINAVSTSALVSACQNLENKLTEINKDFSLSLGSSSEYSFSHASNTGFLSRPSLTKIPNQFSTETSRCYKFSVAIELPFPQASYNYRREGSFYVTYGANRVKTVNFKMLYTAGGSNSALDNYSAGTGGKAWAATVLNALGGTYEIVSENFQEEMEEKILNATLSYKQIPAYQNSHGLNDSSIVDPQCTYSVDIAQQVGYSDAGYSQIPIATVSIVYSTAIDKEVVSNENNMEAVYEFTVKPWLISHAYDILNLGDYSQIGQNNYVVQSEKKNVNPYAYTISGSISFTTAKTSDQILMLSEIVTIDIDEGIHPHKYWDGQPYTNGTWSMGATKSMQRIIVISKMEEEPNEPNKYPDDNLGKWIKMTSSKKKQINMIGVGSDSEYVNSKKLYTVTFFESYHYVIPVSISRNIDLTEKGAF